MKPTTKLDNKFRYVILSSKRAKQLLQGAKPKVRMKTKNLIRIAQEEVKRGLVEYEIIKPEEEGTVEAADEIFIGEEVAGSEPETEAKEKTREGKKESQPKPEKDDKKSPEPEKRKK